MLEHEIISRISNKSLHTCLYLKAKQRLIAQHHNLFRRPLDNISKHYPYHLIRRLIALQEMASEASHLARQQSYRTIW